MKLDFEGEEDDIVKRLEMGNINMPLEQLLDYRCTESLWFKRSISIWEYDGYYRFI